MMQDEFQQTSSAICKECKKTFLNTENTLPIHKCKPRHGNATISIPPKADISVNGYTEFAISCNESVEKVDDLKSILRIIGMDRNGYVRVAVINRRRTYEQS